MAKLTAFARTFGIAALFLSAALAGTAGGVVFAFVGDLPQISALDDYSLGTITRVLGRDGSVVGDFATERRVVVTYDQIPEVLRQAMISAEDADFFSHGGVDFLRVAKTAFRRTVGLQRAGGASTLTSNCPASSFSRTTSIGNARSRKRSSRSRSKSGTRSRKSSPCTATRTTGATASTASRPPRSCYFAKSVKDLTLDEAALIAGMLQSNVRQSPYINMKAATARRNYTLDRMAAEGYITLAAAEEAKKRPIVTRGQPSQPPSLAPYFLETIRTQLEEKYGAKALYENGLVVRTGLDPALQRAANQALSTGLRRIDKLRGYRRADPQSPRREAVDRHV